MSFYICFFVWVYACVIVHIKSSKNSLWKFNLHFFHVGFRDWLGLPDLVASTFTYCHLCSLLEELGGKDRNLLCSSVSSGICGFPPVSPEY